MNYYFITGTSRGLGKALAEKILSTGDCKVFGIGRTSTIINPNYTHFNIDLSLVCELEKEIENVFQSLINPKKIVLLNNSGILGDVKYSGNPNAKSIIEVFNVNTIAPAILINSFIKKYLKVDAEKLIINISSGAGKNPIDGWSNYCSSKAALDMYSRVVDLEQTISNSGFKIYSIAPGVVDTKMQSEIRNADKNDFSLIEKFKDYKSENQLSSPKEVAKKYLKIINNPDSFDDVLLDVRNIDN